jgi:hypothetical protein
MRLQGWLLRRRVSAASKTLSKTPECLSVCVLVDGGGGSKLLDLQIGNV